MKMLFAAIHKLKNCIWQWRWFFTSVKKVIFLPRIKSNDGNGILFEGLQRQDFSAAMRIYMVLNNVQTVGLGFCFLYRFFGWRLCFVAKNASGNIIAVEFYYFNKRDIAEHTIHQGFRGVVPEYRRKGIATSLTAYAVKHFSKTKIQGISSRVSLSNEGSLRANLHIGFLPVEQYYDENMKEERYYMIVKLPPPVYTSDKLAIAANFEEYFVTQRGGIALCAA